MNGSWSHDCKCCGEPEGGVSEKKKWGGGSTHKVHSGQRRPLL